MSGDNEPSSPEVPFSKTSSDRVCVGGSGDIGYAVTESIREGEAPGCIVLALFLPSTGDVFDGSKRVKDLAVCIADGRLFRFPVEKFLDILGLGGVSKETDIVCR